MLFWVIAARLPIVKLKIRPTDLCGVFRGSDAVASGVLTADQLRGPQFRRLYRDVYLPGMLYTKVLRSPHPHAKVTKIDTKAAAPRSPGIR